jgi:hypothetical protein
MKGRNIINDELGGTGRKILSQHFPGGEKNHNKLGQNSQPAAQEINPRPLKYEATVQTTQQQLLVKDRKHHEDITCA